MAPATASSINNDWQSVVALSEAMMDVLDWEGFVSDSANTFKTEKEVNKFMQQCVNPFKRQTSSDPAPVGGKSMPNKTLMMFMWTRLSAAGFPVAKAIPRDGFDAATKKTICAALWPHMVEWYRGLPPADRVPELDHLDADGDADGDAAGEEDDDNEEVGKLSRALEELDVEMKSRASSRAPSVDGSQRAPSERAPSRRAPSVRAPSAEASDDEDAAEVSSAARSKGKAPAAPASSRRSERPPAAPMSSAGPSSSAGPRSSAAPRRSEAPMPSAQPRAGRSAASASMFTSDTAANMARNPDRVQQIFDLLEDEGMLAVEDDRYLAAEVLCSASRAYPTTHPVVRVKMLMEGVTAQPQNRKVHRMILAYHPAVKGYSPNPANRAVPTIGALALKASLDRVRVAVDGCGYKDGETGLMSYSLERIHEVLRG